MEVQPSLFKQNVVAYFRRSTTKQSCSIDAQRNGVQTFCKANNLHIIAEYEDTASGKIDEREGLLEAVALAKKQRIPLVILRVCRLGRKLSTLASYFEDSNLTIYIAELGMKADFMTASIMAVMAAQEAKLISKRTKEGLAAVKARGVKLGNPTPAASLAKCKESNLARGKATIDKYGALIVSLRDSRLSYQKVADKLVEMEIPTPSKRSRWWSATQVMRIYKVASATKQMRRKNG